MIGGVSSGEETGGTGGDVVQSEAFQVLREDLRHMGEKVEGIQREVSEMRERMAVERVKLAAITGGVVTVGNLVAYIVIRVVLSQWLAGSGF